MGIFVHYTDEISYEKYYECHLHINFDIKKKGQACDICIYVTYGFMCRICKNFT